jgi:hypothetical protein
LAIENGDVGGAEPHESADILEDAIILKKVV